MGACLVGGVTVANSDMHGAFLYHELHIHHSVGRRYIGMARVAQPTQYTFKAIN